LADSHTKLGNLLAGLGQPAEAEAEYDQAEAAYTKVLECPQMPCWWHLKHNYAARGILHLNRKKYAAAVSDFSRVIELDPENAVAWNNRGAAYIHLHQYDKAVADYTKAIKLKPKNAAVWNSLAWQLATCPDLRLRDPGQAVAHAKKAVELAPDSGMIWNTLGVAQYRNGDWKAAVEALRKSVQLRQGSDSADFFFLAMAHWQLGEKQKARAWYDRAVAWMDKNRPQNEELNRFRSEAAALLGLTKAAQTQNKKD
jgi:tetratricopeptide (TPR) repeat protein